MRPDVTIRQRAEKGVTERVQTHITIRMRGKVPVMRDVDTAKAYRPVAIAEPVNIITVAGANI